MTTPYNPDPDTHHAMPRALIWEARTDMTYNLDPDTHHAMQQRREDAYRLRHAAALANKNAPLPTHRPNGDEERYPSHIGSFSKTLPHTPLGEAVPAAYEALLHALRTGRP